MGDTCTSRLGISYLPFSYARSGHTVCGPYHSRVATAEDACMEGVVAANAAARLR